MAAALRDPGGLRSTARTLRPDPLWTITGSCCTPFAVACPSRGLSMKRVMWTMVLLAAVVMSGRAAQAPPNLTGTWRPQNPMAGQANPFEFTITQTADSVTIRTPLNNPESVTMKLNGEETRTELSGGRGGAVATATSRAAWESSKLVVT